MGKFNFGKRPRDMPKVNLGDDSGSAGVSNAFVNKRGQTSTNTHQSLSDNGRKRSAVVPTAIKPANGTPNMPAAPIAYVSDEDLEVALDVVRQLRANPDLFRSPKFKKFRAELFPLVQAPAGGHISRISDALSDCRWDDALLALEGLKKTGEIPKLGTVQRWVRDCDLAGVEDTKALTCLDMLLRVACPEQVARTPIPADATIMRNVDVNNHSKDQSKGEGEELNSTTDNTTEGKPTEGIIYRLPEWSGCPLQPENTSFEASIAIRHQPKNEELAAKFSVFAKDLAHNRKPPNLHDLPIWVAEPHAIKMELLSERKLKVKRTEVPSVTGTFYLQDVLSKEECAQILTAAESVGFTPDVPFTDKTKSILAHNFCWLADSSFMQHLWERVEPFLQPKIHDQTLAGINPRFRCYRYEPGALYRPHVDGAWPPSGIDPETNEYKFDMSDGTLWSKMTFLMYLNEGFEGGWTTFYTPAMEDGKLIASPVGPRVGGVLVFPHGDTSGALVHEGSGVLKGCKYIIRTEVIYTKGTTAGGK